MPSTILLPSAPSVASGSQEPRIRWAPEYKSTAGDDAIQLAKLAGLELDPWQQSILRDALGERPNGKWTAPTVGLVCPRQNGKNAILEARELAGLFLFGEEAIAHTAHEQKTASRQFRRMETLIKRLADLQGLEEPKMVRGKGSESIEMPNGQVIFFSTRTGGGNRGLSYDLLVFDEAYELSESAISAVVPTRSARPNPQTWYTSSAVDQQKHNNGVALARQRERGLAQRPRMAYFEWSIEGSSPDVISDEVAGDPVSWAQANPGYGWRISDENVQSEFDGDMGRREFMVERLGVGDWPATTNRARQVINPADWAACADPSSVIPERFCLAFDVSPDRRGSIFAAGLRKDGKVHLELIDNRAGTNWMVPALLGLQKKHRPLAIGVDVGGPASSLIPELEQLVRELQITELGAKELVQSCGLFYDAVKDHTITHLSDPALDDAVTGAKQRTIGQSWGWDRKDATVDISPLVAATLAHMLAKTVGGPVKVDSFSSWQARQTPEALAEKVKAREKRMADILAKGRPQ